MRICHQAYTQLTESIQTLNRIKLGSKDEAVTVVTGLKTIFSKEDLESLLRNAKLYIATFREDESLECGRKYSPNTSLESANAQTKLYIKVNASYPKMQLSHRYDVNLVASRCR